MYTYNNTYMHTHMHRYTCICECFMVIIGKTACNKFSIEASMTHQKLGIRYFNQIHYLK